MPIARELLFEKKKGKKGIKRCNDQKPKIKSAHTSGDSANATEESRKGSTSDRLPSSFAFLKSKKKKNDNA